MARVKIEVKPKCMKKVLLVGDAGVGKTELSERLNNKPFSQRYIPTIGVEFTRKDYDNLILEVWDLSGGDYSYTFERLQRGADALIICCDLSNRTSFNNLERYINDFRAGNPKAPIIIAGTKQDLEEEHRLVSNQELQRLAEVFGCDCVLTSAKTGLNVQELFKNIADKTVVDQEEEVPFGSNEGEFAVGLQSLRNDISRQSNDEFKFALNDLCNKLLSNIDQNGINPNNMRVLQATQTMLQNLESHPTNYQHIFENYETDCKQTRNLGSTLLKAIGVVIITGIFAAVGVSVGAVLGAGVGILAGAWSGPGTAASGVLGLFTGSVTGWALGVAAAAAVTGIAFGAVGVVLGHHGLFKLNDVEKAVENVIESGEEASYKRFSSTM